MDGGILFARRTLIRFSLIAWLGFLLFVAVVPVRAVVTMLGFHATPEFFEANSDWDIILDWETATELDNAGFYIQRSDSQGGTYTRISPFIPSEADDPLEGAFYLWIDEDVIEGTTYWYKLEAIDLNQNSETFGPISSTPGSTNPTITPSVTGGPTATVTPTGSTATPTTTSTAAPTATNPPSTAYPAPATVTSIPTAAPTATLTPQPSPATPLSTTGQPSAPTTGTATLLPFPELTLTFPEGGIVVQPARTATNTAVPVASGEVGASQWSPLGGVLLVVILVFIWVLLAAAFYFSFRRVA